MIHPTERARGPGPEPGSDRGTSVIELVIYMPLLMFVIIVTLQLALAFLGNQAAGAAARETARVARSAGNPAAGSPAAIALAESSGQQYAVAVGHGLISNVRVTVIPVNDGAGPAIRATVHATGVKLVPGVPGLDITKVVEGPVEEFRPDTGTP